MSPDALEKEFGVALPASYKHILTHYPEGLEAPHLRDGFTSFYLIKSLEVIRAINQEARECARDPIGASAYRMPNGAAWNLNYFIIGIDGCGGRYYIDTSCLSDSVFYYDLPEHTISLKSATVESYGQYLLRWSQEDGEWDEQDTADDDN